MTDRFFFKLFATVSLGFQCGHTYQYPALYNFFTVYLMVGNLLMAFEHLPSRWITSATPQFHLFCRAMILWPITLAEFRTFVRDVRGCWDKLTEDDRQTLAQIYPPFRKMK